MQLRNDRFRFHRRRRSTATSFLDVVDAGSKKITLAAVSAVGILLLLRCEAAAAGFPAYVRFPPSRRRCRPRYDQQRRSRGSTPPAPATTIVRASRAQEQDQPKQQQEADPELSTFWHSVKRRSDDNDGGASPGKQRPQLPCVPTLDQDGPLPPGAYYNYDGSNASNNVDAKPTCRISVALNLLNRDANLNNLRDDGENSDIIVNAQDAVDGVQELVDAGFTSFQLKTDSVSMWGIQQQVTGVFLREWGEENVYGRLRRETPASVLDRCSLTTSLSLSSLLELRPSPDTSSRMARQPIYGGSGAMTTKIRETILASLNRIGGDAIDNLQVDFPTGAPSARSNRQDVEYYCLDLLDFLQDMKREGFIRSVSGRNFPVHLLRMSDQYGFPLEGNQIDSNLFTDNLGELPLYENDDDGCNVLGNIPMAASGSLAGGLLTDRHVGRDAVVVPRPWRLTPEERYHLKRGLPRWVAAGATASETRAADNDNERFLSMQEVWDAYRTELLEETFQQIAFKHRVSIASVALRWTLQRQSSLSQLRALPLANNHGGSGASIFDCTVVSCRMELQERKKPRGQELRQVFTFALDDDDMEQLWMISTQGRLLKRQQQQNRRQNEQEHADFREEEEMMNLSSMNRDEDRGGLFLPDNGSKGNRKRRNRRRPSQKLWF